jgi:bifunctional non-homologous end joining protein LigD
MPAYLGIMFKPFQPCLPSPGKAVPSGPDWLHEVKHDGYRLLVHRNGDHVRLITRQGRDYTKRFPWIVEAALSNRHSQFVIDGEAVVLGVDGISDFDALHSGQHNAEVQLYAFDALSLDGDDLRGLPLSMRKASLAKLLARRPSGIFLSTFEQGEIGPDLFRHACLMGLEGLAPSGATETTKLDRRHLQAAQAPPVRRIWIGIRELAGTRISAQRRVVWKALRNRRRFTAASLFDLCRDIPYGLEPAAKLDGR